MNAINEDKKIEKLNIRLSESEKQLFEMATQKAGIDSLSAWARSVLCEKANVVQNTRTKRNLAIALKGNICQFLIEDDDSPLLSIPCVGLYDCAGGAKQNLLTVGEAAKELYDKGKEKFLYEDIVTEGLVVDQIGFTEVLKQGLHLLRETYDFSDSNILLAARIQPSTKDLFKQSLQDAFKTKNTYVIEYGISSAIGIGLQVTDTKPIAVLCIENDWLEICSTFAGGTRGRMIKSIGNDDFFNINSLESKSWQKITNLIKKHFETLSLLHINPVPNRLTTIGLSQQLKKDFYQVVLSACGISVDFVNQPDAAIKGAVKVFSVLNTTNI